MKLKCVKNLEIEILGVGREASRRGSALRLAG
jgi:hypothetical protein